VIDSLVDRSLSAWITDIDRTVIYRY